MFAGKKSAQIREILISESAWEEMTCLFAPSLENTTTTISLQDTAGPDGLKKLLPEFYTEHGARTSFQVYAQKPGGYIFVKEFTPAFYCTEQ